MPAPLLSREELIQRLLDIFRTWGYEGTSISLISKETGLGKASLYHHFPGGKEQMVGEVLEYVKSVLQEHILNPLYGEGAPKDRLDTMIKNIDSFYCGGAKPCVFESLSLNSGAIANIEEIKNQIKAWLKAMATLSQESGYPEKEARERAEQAMASIQGSLIVARATGNKSVFSRALKRLPEELLKH